MIKFIASDLDGTILQNKAQHVDESVLDDEGNIDAKKLDPMIYESPGRKYYRLGECVGNAYSDGHKLERL